jgi:hypothetical protein
MADAVGDPETLAAANMVVGSAMLVTDDQGGRVYLDHSIALAEKHGFDGIVALAYLNIGSSYGEQYRSRKPSSSCDEDSSTRASAILITLGTTSQPGSR